MYAQKGGALVFTLVFVAVFVVILAAWLRFATQQERVTVDQEQEEQSFNIAESGVVYSVSLLNGGVCGPGDLDNPATNTQPLVNLVTSDATGDTVGQYEVSYDVDVLPDGTDVIDVTSLGYDKNKTGRCQQIEAQIRSFDGIFGTRYYVYAWDHKTTVTCGTPSSTPQAVTNCSGS